MIINVKLENEKIVGYRTYPISLNEAYIEVDQFPRDLLSGKYRVVDHQLVICNNTDFYDQAMVTSAFERYKNDVFYGVKLESEEVHHEVINWYQNAMNQHNFTNPPKALLKYLEVSHEY